MHMIACVQFFIREVSYEPIDRRASLLLVKINLVDKPNKKHTDFNWNFFAIIIIIIINFSLFRLSVS